MDEDYTLLARIEAGKRFPPKSRIPKFAKWLSLTNQQLEALVSVERAGLDPFELLPEIAPTNLAQRTIEIEAHKVLRKYCKVSGMRSIPIPVPVPEVVKTGFGLSTSYLDFGKERISGPTGAALYGCLYPEGVFFSGMDKLILVNTGQIRGRTPSHFEQIMTAAHEAGHYILHCGNKESRQLFFRFSKAPSFCSEAGSRQTRFNTRETQATMFAACLLMPREEFAAGIKVFSGSEIALAKHFGVTQWFARLRARTLGCE